MERVYRCSTCNRIFDNEDDCLEHEAKSHPKRKKEKMDLDMAMKVLKVMHMDESCYVECIDCPRDESYCDEGCGGCLDGAVAIVLKEMKKLRKEGKKEKGKC